MCCMNDTMPRHSNKFDINAQLIIGMASLNESVYQNEPISSWLL